MNTTNLKRIRCINPRNFEELKEKVLEMRFLRRTSYETYIKRKREAPAKKAKAPKSEIDQLIEEKLLALLAMQTKGKT